MYLMFTLLVTFGSFLQLVIAKVTASISICQKTAIKDVLLGLWN